MSRLNIIRITVTLIYMLSVILLTVSVVSQAHAKETPTMVTPPDYVARTTYAFLNCNSEEYTEGVTLNGVDMTWATGTGSKRKYIRAQRMADLFKNEVHSSIYSLTECNSTMLADLAKLMGKNWKFVGGDIKTTNKGGWLYDSNKWRTGDLNIFSLPGSQSRKLLYINMYRITPGMADPKLPVALSHLSSGDAASRDAQMTALLDKLGDSAKLLSADTNALSTPDGRDACSSTAPRWQLECRGWEDHGAGVPSFHNFGRDNVPAPGYAIDTISVSPAAQETDKIDVTWSDVVDTQATYVSDHRVLTVGVEFRP